MNAVPIYPVDVSSGRAKTSDDEILRRASFTRVYALNAAELAEKVFDIDSIQRNFCIRC
jgi:hypothetical protein